MKATFAGANIKGTPSMRASSVRHDLKRLRKETDVFGVQEFKWIWYWRVVTALLVNWRTYPSKRKGILHPVNGAQAIFWKRRLFRRIRAHGAPAFDFSFSSRGIMNNRWIRAVLLEAREDKFRAWFLSTHFVVGGDNSKDGPRRKEFLHQNITALNDTLTVLRRTGYPIMGEIDANIHRGTWAYDEFMEMMNRHGAKFHGHHGVEYSFTIDGPKGKFTRVKSRVIPSNELRTDHEVRVLDWSGRRFHNS